YERVDWTAFMALYQKVRSEPVTDNSLHYQRDHFELKSDPSKLRTFVLHRPKQFEPQTAFGPEVSSWAISTAHPWYGKSFQDLRALGAKPFMYIDVAVDHDTYIYQSPTGDLIMSNYRWNNHLVEFDWQRFVANNKLVEEGHKRQTWQDQKGKKTRFVWL
nr:hypothetical protein [Saprospiraceae bacterium]